MEKKLAIFLWAYLDSYLFDLEWRYWKKIIFMPKVAVVIDIQAVAILTNVFAWRPSVARFNNEQVFATCRNKLERCQHWLGGLQLVQRIHTAPADKLQSVVFALGPRFRLVLLTIAVVEYLAEFGEPEDVHATTICQKDHYAKILANVDLTHLDWFVEYLLQLPWNRLYWNANNT